MRITPDVAMALLIELTYGRIDLGEINLVEPLVIFRPELQDDATEVKGFLLLHGKNKTLAGQLPLHRPGDFGKQPADDIPLSYNFV